MTSFNATDIRELFDLPLSFQNGQKLNQLQVIAILNKGCGKTIQEIWESEDVITALGNMLKAVQPDTGGTPGTVPQSCIADVWEIIRIIKSYTDLDKGVEEAGAFLYRQKDTRSKAIRMSQIKRNALARVKHRGGTFQEYVQELTRMVNQTLDEYRKNWDRRKLADDTIMKEATQ